MDDAKSKAGSIHH